jgi:putative transposase
MVVRKKLWINESGLVFVTTTVLGWIPVFNIKSVAIATLHELGKTVEQFHGSLAAYVLMPSHIHIIIHLSDISNLSKFIQTFKSMSSRRVKDIVIRQVLPFAARKYYMDTFTKGDQFRFWRPRFDEFIITSRRQLRIKLDYIHNNPVKAGLVLQPTDWPYSSAADWLKGIKGVIKVEKSLFYM